MNDYTSDAQAVVKIDGYPLFVKGLLKDERAELKVMKVNKNYGFARVHKLLDASTHRREEPCPCAKLCGGCQTQHMDQSAQIEMKRNNVASMIQRIGKSDVQVETPLYGNEFNYRNKTQIPVQVIDNKVYMGFYRRHSNEIIDMSECMIQDDAINEVYKEVKTLLEQHIDIAKMLRHVLFKYAKSTKQMMVVLITRKENIKGLDLFVKELVSIDSKIVSVIQNVNTRNDNVILGDKELTLYNQDYIEDMLMGLQFRISSKSFYQVNNNQTEVLYSKALEFADIKKSERVLDLYCGIGTISLAASKYAKEVVGVEIVDVAIENALANAVRNNITNASFVCSDAASYAKQLEEQHESFEVIIVDPPRKGLDQLAIDSIIKMNPERLVYVSCDPSTLARDIALLSETYTCTKLQPVDMFPCTYHIENVALLIRK